MREEENPNKEAIRVIEEIARRRQHVRAGGQIDRQGLSQAAGMSSRGLGVGLLVCAGCGRRLVLERHRAHPRYICRTRRDAPGACAGQGVVVEVAHAALLREVMRLEGAPWRASATTPPARPPETHDPVATRRALDAERERLRRHVRRLNDLEGDLGDEELVAWRAVSGEIAGRIAALERDLAAVPPAPMPIAGLRALHERLVGTTMAQRVRALSAERSGAALRALVADLVASARVVERERAVGPRWVRVEVAWAPHVQTLLDAGLVRLGPPLPPPPVPTREEMARARTRRYLERRRERRETTRRGESAGD